MYAPPLDAALLQVGDDVQIRTLVRDEIVGIEVARRLGERRDLRGEGRLRRRPRATAGQPPRQREEQRSDPESEQEPAVVHGVIQRSGIEIRGQEDLRIQSSGFFDWLLEASASEPRTALSPDSTSRRTP